MPDQRMHDLRINSERACGRKSCEVHDIRFTDSESVCVSDGDEDAEQLAGIRHTGANGSVWPRGALVESSPFVGNNGKRQQLPSCERNASILRRTDKCFSTGMATA